MAGGGKSRETQGCRDTLQSSHTRFLLVMCWMELSRGRFHLIPFSDIARGSRRAASHYSASTVRERRKTSPTDQAWKGQPHGVWGESPSAISETCPNPASSRWWSSGSRY